MTPDQNERATMWLARRSITCGCGASTFTLSDALVEVAPRGTGGSGSPLVVAIAVCEHCARIHAYDASTMGLI